jgi:peptidoglycan/LPS O-acetylase OafA/YrhL
VTTLRTSENISINAIRTIAALLVVVGHVRHLFFVDYSQSDQRGVFVQALYLIGSLGHPAVIVFFVLSGFWVGGSVIRGTQRGSFKVSSYASARLIRLWIVLVPAVLLTQILDRFGTALFPASDVYAGSGAYHGTLPADGAAAHLDLTTTLGNLFFVQSIHVDTVGNNTPLWSLSYEFWYYLLFPAALLVFARHIAIRWRVLSGLIFLTGTGIAGAEVLILLPTWLLGALIAWKQKEIAEGWSRMSSRARPAIRVALALTLTGTSAATIALSVPRTIGDYAVAVVAGLLLLSLITDTQSRTARAALTPFSWAARWSYSLYATHLPVIALVAAITVPDAAARFQITSVTGVFAGASTITAALLVGLLAWWLTERHTQAFRDWIARWAGSGETAPTAHRVG